jgi:hypothetical protein
VVDSDFSAEVSFTHWHSTLAFEDIKHESTKKIGKMMVVCKKSCTFAPDFGETEAFEDVKCPVIKANMRWKDVNDQTTI